MAELQRQENQILTLQSEKEEWMDLFKEVLRESPSTSGPGGSQRTSSGGKVTDYSPVAALRLLSSAQSRCAVFLKTQSELECSVAEMRKKVASSELSCKESEREKAETKFSLVRFSIMYAKTRMTFRLFARRF